MMIQRFSLIVPLLFAVAGLVNAQDQQQLRGSGGRQLFLQNLLTAFFGGGGQTLESISEATCNYDSSNPNDNSCSLQALQATGDQRFGIFPGGQSRCGFDVNPETGEPNPYFFQVDPGRNGQENNLLLAFQGGGAFLGFDVEEPDARLTPKFFDGGIFDLNRPENPFRDWTRVVITYCTGDIHIGDGFDIDDNGNEYVFNGRKNAITVFNWVAKNLPNPDRVFVYGSSAGASGVQIWSNQILSFFKTLPNPPVLAVVADSSTGLTREVEGISNSDIATKLWKICSPELGLTPEEVDLCEQGVFTNTDFQLKSQAKHRDVPFAYTNFKFDPVLFDGFCGVGNKNCVQPDEFYGLTKDFLRGFVQETNNNVLTYWVNARGHVMGNNNRFYSIDEGIPLLEWFANLATNEDGNPPVLQSDCVEAPLNEDFDGSCDPVLLAASFVSAGAGNPPPSDLPCPCSCNTSDGPGVFLTRPSTGAFQCVEVSRAIQGLQRLDDVACLEVCP